jgi:hypothetical protein
MRFVPSEARLFGPPTAATITIKRSSGIDLPTPVVGLAATVDALSTTLSAAAAAGARTLVLTSVTGVKPGVTYLATGADGEHFEVEVVAVNASTKAVLLIEPLPRDLDVGDLFRGLEVSYALSGAQCPDPFSSSSLYTTAETSIAQSWLYRAAWHYTVAGTDYDADQLYEVRKRLLKPTISEGDVTSLLPATLADLEPGAGVQTVRRQIDTAWGDVLDDLAQAGFNPDLVMDAERLRAAHVSRSLYRLGIRWGPAWKEWTKEQAKAYSDDIQEALAAGDWYDSRQDNVQATDEVMLPHIDLVR